MAAGILDPQPGTEPSRAQGCESAKSSPLNYQGLSNIRIFKSLSPFQKILLHCYNKKIYSKFYLYLQTKF